MSRERRAMEDEIRTLASWASSVAFDGIPDDIKKRAALVIVDDLACAAGSRYEPEIMALKARLSRPQGEATVFLGDAARSDRTNAAMLNAIGSNWCQLDEGHRQVMCHAGLYVVPAALAEAEASGYSVGDLLRATAIGYEVVCRFAQAFRFTVPAAHPHAIWSPLGSTVAVAALRGFDSETFFNSMTAAVTLAAAGPFTHAIAGALIANAWAGLGVASGFRCADLAQCGVMGLPSSPAHVLELIFGANVNSAAIVGGLDEGWALRGGYHKIYSCAQQSHAAVEAMLQLRARCSAEPRNVTRLLVEVHPLALTMDNRAPSTTLAARFSLPHIVAAAYVFAGADAAAFASDTLGNQEVARLRQLVEMQLYTPELSPPHDRAARITLTLDDGMTIVEECLSAEGGPDRPFSSATVLEKCSALADDVYPQFSEMAASLCRLDEQTVHRPCAAFVETLCSD